MQSASDRFQDVVTSEEEIRAVLGNVYPGADTKVIDHLDDICRMFIERSPFSIIASGGGSGDVDLSPKGDPAGFVKVLDAHTLAIPDRPGNNRLDTFRNILRDPKVGMIFLVPGRKDTLRVGGHAQIVRDLALRESMAVQGKVPDFAIVVHVERAFFHCAKCVVRSNLWNPDQWPDLTGAPSLAAAIVQHAKLKMDVQKLDDELTDDEKTGLY